MKPEKSLFKSDACEISLFRFQKNEADLTGNELRRNKK